MIGDFKRFDMVKKPKRQKRYLTPVTWAVSFPSKWARRAKIKKTGMAGIKPPYLLLCNHNSFLDFKIMTAAIFPHRANYVVAIDGFLHMEWLLRRVGAIGNRKFVNSTLLVKNMIHAKNNGDIVVMFPEARYSLCGTSAVLPNSVGKFIRLLGIPVVTLIMHGHHVQAPFWGEKGRGASHLESELRLLFTPEETKSLTVDEINTRLRAAFKYDDFAWQRDRQVKIPHTDRARGLHKVLYQCPECGAEYRMSSVRDELWCQVCGQRWNMSQYGELSAVNGVTRFSHIPDWYEWERENVRREIREGTYSLKVSAIVDSLPNTRGFKELGEAELCHNMDGFTLKGTYRGEPYEETWKPRSLYSCHIEYDYKHRRADCIDLNTATDTLYIYPQGRDFAVTKIALATEELYEFTGKPNLANAN
ncbi:MAG: 1-acyl-sn-glycerol-3-phosphate acyltransferase [Oscillospiraceae bacterium]|jgi:transcription elongation factor Elf1|nr:1-acyl-sn-glycerol-3-phosphate acyltransferase [Oscillospiraceae bacterium]